MPRPLIIFKNVLALACKRQVRFLQRLFTSSPKVILNFTPDLSPKPQAGFIIHLRIRKRETLRSSGSALAQKNLELSLGEQSVDLGPALNKTLAEFSPAWTFGLRRPS